MPAIHCALVAIALLLGGCLRSTEFQCSTNTECGAGNRCEPIGFCSVSDSRCASGLRYSDTAGTYANECVMGGNLNDGGVDSPSTMSDAPMIDAPPAGCPGTYVSITGGQSTHTYRLVPASEDWSTHRAFCTATTNSAYLAIPDDLAELQAIATHANTAQFWIGVSDLTTENAFFTVKNVAATFLPWASGQPNDGPPPEDCVEAVSATSEINDERCNTKQLAVCECEP